MLQSKKTVIEVTVYSPNGAKYLIRSKEPQYPWYAIVLIHILKKQLYGTINPLTIISNTGTHHVQNDRNVPKLSAEQIQRIKPPATSNG
mgnify:CR=1 FL=1